MKGKRVWMILTVLALLFVLAACAGTPKDAQQQAASDTPAQSETAQPASEEPTSEPEPEPEPAQEEPEPEPAPEEPAAEEPAAEESTADPETPLQVELAIEGVNKYGNITLAITPERMTELGFEPADLIRVRIGDREMTMPIGTAYSDVDSGMPVCRYKYDADVGEYVVLAVNTGNMASDLGVAEIRKIDQEPGFECVWAEGYDETTPVVLTMVEKQGYLEQYEFHRTNTRTNSREDYPQLSDAEYANFRAIATTGMGAGVLYRSSTPVNPKLNRNKEADAQIAANGIRTVINMVDREEDLKAFPDYEQTNYARCDVIALFMDMEFFSDDFSAKLADALRFIASHEGPYLIHCTEGKDRTGFAAALLECLMGASRDEVIADYMVTYENYYGLTPEDPQYNRIAESNIAASLTRAFGTDFDALKDADLSACAQAYLESIGMSEAEIEALRSALGVDYSASQTEENAA